MEECISHNELLFVNNRFCLNIEDFINSIRSIKDDFEALNYWLVPLIYDGVLLKWLQQVGEEEGMALVKQIEISKDRSETAQATIKRLLLELDLLN
jgi:type II secretory pathway component PulM